MNERLEGDDLLLSKGHNHGPTMGPDISEAEAVLKQDNRLLTVKLRLAHGFQSLMLTAYDALLHHGVNYRELPEHKDQTLLDRGLKANLEDGEKHIHSWLERVLSGITAAVRRKGFRKV